jgi:hypothetical protein
VSKKKKLILGKIVFATCILLLLYGIVNVIIANSILKRNGKCIKAVLYRETLSGKTHPSFGYNFSINGKTYSGLIDENGSLEIGDTICVVYLKFFPRMNRPLNYFNNEEIKCECEKQ